jgi:hypothetical protein
LYGGEDRRERSAVTCFLSQLCILYGCRDGWGYQVGLAGALDTIEAQEEGRRARIEGVFCAVQGESADEEMDAVLLSLVVHYCYMLSMSIECFDIGLKLVSGNLMGCLVIHDVMWCRTSHALIKVKRESNTSQFMWTMGMF